MHFVARNILAFCAIGLTFSASAFAQQPKRLKLASPAPAPALINKIFDGWAKKVTEESAGTLVIDFVPGGVLGREGQLLDRVASGALAIAWDFQGYYPGKYPKTGVVEQPFQFKTAEQGSRALQKLYDSGLLAGEYDDVKVLGLFTFPNASVMLAKPLDDLSSLGGRKITAQNPTMQAAVGRLGGVRLNMGIPEWYQALSRGAIDGAIVTFTAVPAFRLNEVMSFYVDVSLGGNPGMFLMNKAVYASLPESARKAIDANSGLAFSVGMGAFLDKWNDTGKNIAAKGNNRVVTLAPADQAKWEAELLPLGEKWVAETKNGDAIAKAFRAEAAK